MKQEYAITQNDIKLFGTINSFRKDKLITNFKDLIDKLKMKKL